MAEEPHHGNGEAGNIKPAELAAICRYVEMLLRSSGSEVMTALSDAYGTLFTVYTTRSRMYVTHA